MNKINLTTFLILGVVSLSVASLERETFKKDEEDSQLLLLQGGGMTGSEDFITGYDQDLVLRREKRAPRKLKFY